jgi:beta-galactosidase
VDQAFDQVTYYGRGPFENYPDRKTGAKMGVYRAKAADFYVPYLIPQEHGNRSDVYWTAIQNESGKGIMISSKRQFNHSVSVFSQDNLTRAVYPFQLKPDEGITLNVDYVMSGLGDTSRMTMTNYRTGTSKQEFQLTIRPVRGNPLEASEKVK